MMLNYCIQYILEETAALMLRNCSVLVRGVVPEGRYCKTKYKSYQGVLNPFYVVSAVHAELGVLGF